MIVISSSLVLSETGLTADHPIIGYRNIVKPDNIVADHEDAAYPATNLANPATHLMWKSDDDGEQYLTITTGSAEPIDYVGIATHNFGSAEIAVSFEGDTGGGFSQLIAPFIPGGDGPLLLRFSPTSFTAVRLKLAAGAASPQAAVIYVGKLLVVERRVNPPHTPITMGRVIQAVNGRSQSGKFLGSIVTGESRAAGIAFENLSDDWYRDNMDAFAEYAAYRNPFFFAWLPQTYPSDIGYGCASADPRPSIHRSNGMMEISIDVDAVA